MLGCSGVVGPVQVWLLHWIQFQVSDSLDCCSVEVMVGILVQVKHTLILCQLVSEKAYLKVSKCTIGVVM